MRPLGDIQQVRRTASLHAWELPAATGRLGSGEGVDLSFPVSPARLAVSGPLCIFHGGSELEPVFLKTREDAVNSYNPDLEIQEYHFCYVLLSAKASPVQEEGKTLHL